MAGVDFDKWCTRPRWTVHEGAMLLIGEDPIEKYSPSQLVDRSKSLLYARIIAAAKQDLVAGKLRTDWVTRYPLPAGPDSAEYTEVSPSDFFRWALRRKFPMNAAFKAAALNMLRARNTGASKTKGATQARVAAQQTRRDALRKFINQSVERATKGDRQWALMWSSCKELPCTTQQFMDEFFSQNRDVKQTKYRTIQTDLKNLGIRLKQGSRQKAPNPLSELWPKKKSR